MSGAFLGNGTWQSAVYALWDSIFCVGLFTALIVFFRRLPDRQTRFAGALSSQTLLVFLVHIPVLVFLAIALRDLSLPGLLKFVIVAVIGVPLSFTIANLIRKIALVSRVL